MNKFVNVALSRSWRHTEHFCGPRRGHHGCGKEFIDQFQEQCR